MELGRGEKEREKKRREAKQSEDKKREEKKREEKRREEKEREEKRKEEYRMKWNAMEWNRLDKGSREGRKIKVGNSKIASLIKYSIPYHSGTIMCSSRKYPYPTKEGIYK